MARRLQILLFPALLLLAGCNTLELLWEPAVPAVPPGAVWMDVPLICTGYCSCQKCTGWKRNWRGKPVYAYGRNKGKPKVVGLTASGVMAKKGTIAADTKFFPFGTRMFVPGYGYGVVEDRGGAIKGKRLDLYFSSHKAALTWGKQIRMVRVLVHPRLPDRAATAERSRKSPGR